MVQCVYIKYRTINDTEDETRLDIFQSHIGVILIKMFCLRRNLYVSYTLSMCWSLFISQCSCLTPYQLRTRSHRMTLINKTKFLNDTDFIIRFLYIVIVV